MRAFCDFVPQYVRDFDPYTPSRPDHMLRKQYGVDHLYRLNNNENALGPPPKAKAVVERFEGERGAIYPSGDCFDLRNTLAERFNMLPEQFLVGNGSCEVITSVIKAFCQPGDNIVTADKTFAVYEWVAKFSGIDARLVKLKHYGFDSKGFLEARTQNTKIMFVCNPNNPTGTLWNKRTMESFLQELDGRSLVVVDEAYREFVDDADCPDGMDLIRRHPNVLVFRTFSKMYGLAGLRVGYLCGHPELVDFVRRTHIVYSVNSLGQLAAAAAMEDDAEHIAATKRMVDGARRQLTGLFDAMGLEHVGSYGNFVMVRLPVSDTTLYRQLMRKGVMVRTMTSFRFPNWIRVTLGRQQAMDEFCRHFSALLRA